MLQLQHSYISITISISITITYTLLILNFLALETIFMFFWSLCCEFVRNLWFSPGLRVEDFCVFGKDPKWPKDLAHGLKSQVLNSTIPLEYELSGGPFDIWEWGIIFKERILILK